MAGGTFINNRITAGRGFDGPIGGGLVGGTGGSATSGALHTVAPYDIRDVTFDNNRAIGGTGGKGSDIAVTAPCGGGFTPAFVGGPGGAGSAGAANFLASGSVQRSLFVDNVAQGGTGGAGGAGQSATPASGNCTPTFGGGAGGIGGVASGGAIVTSGVGNVFTNVTVHSNTFSPGFGGPGGTGGLGSGGSPPASQGAGGLGANGLGGGIFGTIGGTYTHMTITQNGGLAGAGGVGVPPGSAGTSFGGNLWHTTAPVLNSTIIAEGAASTGPNCVFGGALAGSNGTNLQDTATAECGLTAGERGHGVTIALGPLQNNGGPTSTRLPSNTSVAIDRGGAPCPTNVAGADTTKDQRSVTRPFDFGVAGPAGFLCDVGAVEVAAPPNLTVTKTFSGAPNSNAGGLFDYTFVIANTSANAANFFPNDIIFFDSLPNAGMTYGATTVNTVNVTGGGTVSCSINGTFDLICTATGGLVTVGATTGTITISVAISPTIVGTFDNPRAGGFCKVDPGNPPSGAGNGVVIESDENDNLCTPNPVTFNSVGRDLTATKTNNVGGAGVVGVPWTWTIRVQNVGGRGATFASGSTILTDNLPNTNIVYGAVSVINQTNLTGSSGTVSCTAAPNIVCTASGGTIAMDQLLGRFDVQFTATASVAAVYGNPRAGGVCNVDTLGVITELNATGTGESNNTCTDSVTVAGPSVGPTATFTVSKDFTDNSAGVAQVTLTCTGATPDAPTKPASENPNSPAVFTVSSIGAGATCTASEAAIAGYAQHSTTCVPGTAVIAGGTPSCVFVNQPSAAPSADLSLTKTGGSGNVAPGAHVTYTLTLTNNGPGTANNVVLIDPVPANTTFVAASQTSGPAFTMLTPAVGGTGNVQFSAATMANGLSAVFSITVQVNAATPNGTTIVNTATVSSASDPTVANNAPTVSGTVLSAGAAPTPTPTASPTPTPVTLNVPSRIPPQIFQNPASQGIIYGNRSTPVPRPAVAPAVLPSQQGVTTAPVITPPRTGDAGIATGLPKLRYW